MKMRRQQKSFVPTEEDLRRHYAKTALARMGIPYERAMRVEALRNVIDGAARAEERMRMMESKNGTEGAILSGPPSQRNRGHRGTGETA